MRFKHAFHVFVDNFGATFKLLLYKLIVGLISVGLACAVIIPTVRSILSIAEYVELQNAFDSIWSSFKSITSDSTDTTILEGIKGVITGIENTGDAFKQFTGILLQKAGLIAIVICSFAAIYIISRFLAGIGNYTMGVLVNDKMSLHANSSFTHTLIKNLGKSSLYSIIYVPIAFAYDVIGFILIWAITFKALAFVPLIFKIFLVSVMIILLYAVKFTFTCDWLPALIHDKMNNRQAIKYSFLRKGKQTGGVFSTALVIIILIIIINVIVSLFTFGAGTLLTLPATQLILTSYFFVNYFDTNKLKYFVDEYTIIGPQKEKPPTREEFFKGDE